MHLLLKQINQLRRGIKSIMKGINDGRKNNSQFLWFVTNMIKIDSVLILENI